MSSYNLYETLGLDRNRTPDQLDAELTKKLAGVIPQTPEWNEIDAAKKVLGNPTKRQMYDKRLDDPTQNVEIRDLQQLAVMSVHGWADQATASSTGGGLKGAAKDVYTQYPKATIGTGVLAVVVVVAVVGAIVSIFGGGSGSSDTESNNAAAKQTPISDDDEYADAKRKYLEYDFLSGGEEWGVDADEDGTDDYYISIDNLRTATYTHTPKVKSVDPYEATAGCVDIKSRLSDTAISDIKKGLEVGVDETEMQREPTDTSEMTWGERKGYGMSGYGWDGLERERITDIDYDSMLGSIADDTWGLSMRWIKNGDNKWQGIVSPIHEDSRTGSRSDSEIVSVPESLSDPADGEFRDNATVHTRCFDGRLGWGTEHMGTQLNVTGYYVMPSITTVPGEANKREYLGWKFDTNV